MAIPFRRRRPGNEPPLAADDRFRSMAQTNGRVLHLCRYPEKCCTTCDRHRERCAHPIGRVSW